MNSPIGKVIGTVIVGTVSAAIASYCPASAQPMAQTALAWLCLHYGISYLKAAP